MAEQTSDTLVGAQGPCREAACVPETVVAVFGEGTEYAVVFGDLTAHRHLWELEALPIGPLAKADAALLLFTAVAELPFALVVAQAWGFVYESIVPLKGRLADSHVSHSKSADTTCSFALLRASTPRLPRWPTRTKRLYLLMPFHHCLCLVCHSLHSALATSREPRTFSRWSCPLPVSWANTRNTSACCRRSSSSRIEGRTGCASA